MLDQGKRVIKISYERIIHIYKHPEMQNRIGWVEEAIRWPDFIEEDLYRKERRYYYKYLREEKKYIMVVIRIKGNEGEVITAYLVEK